MTGLVTKSTGSWYTVRTEEDTVINCRIKGKFRISGIKSTNPVTVGDIVDFEIEESNCKPIEANTYYRCQLRPSVFTRNS